MSEPPSEYVRRPSWHSGLDYWVPDGEPGPDIPWPDNFEVCGVPAYEPMALRDPKRHGTLMMVWPMFDIDDPLQSVDVFCSVLEQMSSAALDRWYRLPDRFLHMGAGDVEMDANNLDSIGFTIPGETMQRIRRLRLRIQITLHPHLRVINSCGC